MDQDRLEVITLDETKDIVPMQCKDFDHMMDEVESLGRLVLNSAVTRIDDLTERMERIEAMELVLPDNMRLIKIEEQVNLNENYEALMRRIAQLENDLEENKKELKSTKVELNSTKDELKSTNRKLDKTIVKLGKTARWQSKQSGVFNLKGFQRYGGESDFALLNRFL